MTDKDTDWREDDQPAMNQAEHWAVDWLQWPGPGPLLISVVLWGVVVGVVLGLLTVVATGQELPRDRSDMFRDERVAEDRKREDGPYRLIPQQFRLVPNSEMSSEIRDRYGRTQGVIRQRGDGTYEFRDRFDGRIPEGSR